MIKFFICFLNTVILHHAQHALSAKFLSSFASLLKGHLLHLVLNLSGLFAHAPNIVYWKRRWTVNPHSAFPGCSGPYKHLAQLCQFRLGVLISSAIPVSLCACGFELPSIIFSPLFQLCSLFFQTGIQTCTQHMQYLGFILTWCCLLLWSVFHPQLFYVFFWSLLNTGMTFPDVPLW